MNGFRFANRLNLDWLKANAMVILLYFNIFNCLTMTFGAKFTLCV